MTGITSGSSLVNLSSNGIRGFGAQTFIDASRVEYFYLRDNEINEFADKRPLRYLTSLKLLDLTAAFDEKITSRRRQDLLRSLFENDHDFQDLEEIILASNRLEHVHSDTFCRAKSLTRLILRDNLLTSFDFERGCIGGLSLLDLRNNRIFSIPSSLWKQLPQLNNIDVSRNPLHCDCNLQQFHEFARDDLNAFLGQQETTCKSPRKVRGIPIFDLEEDFCGTRGSGFRRWLLLFFFVGIAVAVYQWLKRNGRPIRLPFAAGSYSQLKETNEEGAAQPAFV
ncbi:LRRCT domain-containing protein [Aphelenchoides fujianensis]|nr:LRRCT domain-containing protein [Aphelenchoides fujianensis]